MEGKLKKSRLKLDKAEEKRDKAAEKIPKKKQKRLYEKEKPKSKLDFEKIKAKPSDKLLDKPKPPSVVVQNLKKAPRRQVAETLHKEIAKEEDDNVGVKSAHKTEETIELAGRKVENYYHRQKLKPYADLEKAEKKLRTAQVNYSYNKVVAENPQAYSNPLSKWKQKQAIKKQYANARKAGTATANMGTTIKSTIKKGADTVIAAAVNAVKNPKILLLLGFMLLIIIACGGMFSSCSVMLQGGLNSIVGTSYNSEERDIVATDNSYKDLEKELQERIDNIESDYPGYDEYRYNLDEIGHNSHELASYLTALLKYYKENEVQGELQQVFDLQYELTLKRVVETRYRTEHRTDSEGNSYTVQVPYQYYILYVTLTNTPVNEVAQDLLTAEQLRLFEVYLETKGNKPNVFGDIYSETDSSQDLEYQVPAHNLTDAEFGKMLKEAEKYLGYPYVWGGSSPSTSFDCSGFVCWVINQSGVGNIPRTTATGIYNQTTRIPKNEAKPGDIIFFEGTYASSGAVSHVGIYVGDGMMIHCGNPIGYANINSKYWSEHFYAFGRLN